MQNFTLKINIPSVNVPTSDNKVFIFKLTIDDYYKNDSELTGSNFFLLAPIKSVAFFFWDTRYILTLNDSKAPCFKKPLFNNSSGFHQILGFTLVSVFTYVWNFPEEIVIGGLGNC